ncbi:MAG: 4-hydroxy-tetrahydrodipicolinate synthase [Firmicutes bacterium HGW-Firmicutes-15]|nr:MAG: 4-hydroxy-tetrahydrodipicolinate synthase [Firmicutes bacterium HGW-Firmicutes-15]
MAMLKMFTAMITPYHSDLQVNYTRAGEIAEHLADTGSDGIVVSGTTGESPVLSKEEKLELFAAVKAKVGSRVEVWAGTGSYDTKASVSLSQAAEKVGMDGLLVVTPYYNKPSQEGLYQHFKTIAESVSIPIMLYNIPGRTGTNMLPETVARLADIENIVALKESSGNMDQLSILKNIVPDTVSIFSGDDSLTLPMLALGAAGVVSIASHLVGKEIKHMLEFFAAGDVNQAQQLHNYLFPMFKGLFITTNPVPVKEALNILGMGVGGLRLPLCNANEGEIIQLKELLSRYNLLK